jgi:hypothetical protein
MGGPVAVVWTREVVIRIRDLGPLPGPAELGAEDRFEAELPDYPVACGYGASPWAAVHRLVGVHRAVLERRWSSGALADRATGSGGFEPSATGGRARERRP